MRPIQQPPTLLSKIRWGVLVLVCLGAPAHAQSFLGLFGNPPPPVDFGPSVSAQEVAEFVTILEDKTWSLHPEGGAIAEKIPVNARYALYERYRIAGAWGLLNLYGVGSFFQGDPGTSLVALGGLAALEATVITASRYPSDQPEYKVWVATGATLAGAAYLYGLVRPWFYADEQNRALKAMLFGTK